MRMKINANLPCLSALFAAALLLSGCASQQYMGVSLKPGGADPAVQALAARASIGDKQAQFQLGLAFENGLGLERNCRKAKALFRESGRDKTKSMYLYSPSIGGGTSSRVIAIDYGRASEGLPEARVKLYTIPCL